MKQASVLKVVPFFRLSFSRPALGRHCLFEKKTKKLTFHRFLMLSSSRAQRKRRHCHVPTSSDSLRNTCWNCKNYVQDQVRKDAKVKNDGKMMVKMIVKNDRET